MRVLLAHNTYQLAGGEDAVFEAEAADLEARGHEVVRYVVSNDAIHGTSLIRAGLNAQWNRKCYREVAAICREQRPDIAHFHNTFPWMSPGVLHAAKRAGVPVVQTLHNYRLICPNALLFRQGRTCEDCVGKSVPWPAIRHKCYRGSRAASFATAATLAYHRMRGTWLDGADVLIALSEFAKDRFVAGGLPVDRLHVKPNFLASDPGSGDGSGGYALFVGRLSAEKGLATLLEAWKALEGRIPLKIVGSGPLENLVNSAASSTPGIEAMGAVPHSEVLRLMRGAALLVFPSSVYEGMPLSMIEAMASGLPIVAGNHGSMPELVDPGLTGWLFDATSPADLTRAVGAAFADLERLQAMRTASRERYLSNHGSQVHHDRLMELYALAREHAARSSASL